MDMRYTIENYDEENYPDAWIGQAIYNSKTMELISVVLAQKDKNEKEYNKIKNNYEAFNFYDSENKLWNTYAKGSHPYIVIEELMSEISDWATKEASAIKTKELVDFLGEEQYNNFYDDFWKRQ